MAYAAASEGGLEAVRPGNQRQEGNLGDLAREELLLGQETLGKVWTLRRMVAALGGGPEAVIPVLERLTKTRNNAEFLATLNKEMI